MADPFVAEIRMFPFSFAPKGWAFCNGQLMPISQNTALFSLLGTNYGGDGKSTFGLPDLQGSAPMQQGQGQGLSDRVLGEMSGVETITLLVAEMPLHTHQVTTTNEDGNNTQPATRYYGRGNAMYSPTATLGTMAIQTLSPAGGGLPHSNLQPYLTLNFCIALQGVFPARP
jgi:microcystin-dependent protein